MGKFQRVQLEGCVVDECTVVGVDPKSIVCEFFRSGQCTKGDKCKFSHNIEQSKCASQFCGVLHT